MLEEKLERIAVALEAMVAGRNLVIWPAEGAPGTEAKDTPVEGPRGVEDALPRVPTDKEDPRTREQIKSALHAKGVKFKDAARTETLREMLHAAESVNREVSPLNSAPGVNVVTENVFAGVSPSSATPPVLQPLVYPPEVTTKDMVRDGLIQLSGAKGKDVALLVLKEVGKADKLGDVKEELYAALVKACREKGGD